MPVIITDGSAGNKTVVLYDSTWQDRTSQWQGATNTNPGSNATTDSTFDSWDQAGSSFTSVRSTGGHLRADAAGISGHNLASTASSVSIQYSEDTTTWTNATPAITPTTDEPILFLFPSVFANTWRIAVSGPGGASISNVKIGQRLEFPCTPINGYVPVQHSRRYDKYFNNSIAGHLLGNRVMAAGGETTVEFPEIERQFVDGPLLGFADHYNRGRPFFYAGWPGGKPQDVAYAWADGQTSKVDVAYTNGSRLATVEFGMSLFYGR